ncbi:MAG: hypothetical protein ACJ72O_07735 [Marmoricola sp.]
MSTDTFPADASEGPLESALRVVAPFDVDPPYEAEVDDLDQGGF